MEILLIVIIIIIFIGYFTNAFNKTHANKKKTNKSIRKASGDSERFIKDTHYTDYVEKVIDLKKQKEHSKAIELLLKLVHEVEKEAKIQSKRLGYNWGVAPWYYEQLAIIYRKEKRFNDEVAILERYMQQEGVAGDGGSKMEQRLIKAKELAASQNSSKPVRVTFNYNPHIIRRQGVQILESLHILATTKNIDTLKGRFEFIDKQYVDFVKASSHKRFVSDIQHSIDEYKATYYERIPDEYEINLLIKPSIENLITFYIECIFYCFKRFLVDQEKQIESLKRQEAKDRRIKKILTVAKEAKTEMINKSIDEQKINKHLEEIEQIIRENNRHIEN